MFELNHLYQHHKLALRVDYSRWRGGSVVIVLIALFFIRKKTKSMGLQPDGGLLEGEEGGDVSRRYRAPPVEYSWTRSQAVRSFAFWALTTALGLRMLSMSTLNIFGAPTLSIYRSS